MALGQAFVEIHADLTPFRRNLQRDLKRITDEFEKQLSSALGSGLKTTAQQTGQQIGDTLGRETSRGMQKHLGDKNAGIFVSITSALAGALDDGISALPMEVKAALVAGILAASPLVAGALSAAITAGLGLAFAGIGVALASQFESVQSAWPRLVSGLRLQLVSSAGAFEKALLGTFALIQLRFAEMGPLLERIFSTSATFLEPFVGQLLDAVESFLTEMDKVLGESGAFINELGAGLKTLADAAALALGILASTGEDGRKALRDLIMAVAALTVGVAGLIAALTKAYGLIRDTLTAISRAPAIIQILFPLAAGIGHVIDATDDMNTANVAAIHTNTDLIDSQGGVIAKTKEEEQAIKALRDAIADAADAALDAILSNVAYEESIDDLAQSLKENGKNINIDTENGRENVRAFAKSIQDLRKDLVDRVTTGELTTEQAVAQYNREIERIEALGNSAGITDQQFYDLYGTAIALGELQIAPDTSGIDAATASVEELNAAAKAAIATLRHLASVAASGAVAGGQRGLAAGGFAHFPETVSIAEEGPEVVIPLTKPARAAELMKQAGLDKMAGGGGSQVLVFIDGKQMEGRMVQVAERVTAQQGLALAQGFRGL